MKKKRFWNINAEISNRREELRKNNEHWQKTSIYIINYNEKWESILKGLDDEVEIHSDDW
jgi:hypothetical protein